ncbi:probable RNA-directed DNA polymerase from transposon X-element [Trichonephila clavipes]|nr:probable RNA-directed DNA polymerase from transposon X-element [Trichonephila clavipes]
MDKYFFGLSIFSWNADGVGSRIVEIRDFIDKHSPDIFLIQETHLRPEHSFKIPNYTCYRNDRTHPAPGRGGTAILIKNFISHYHVPTPPLFTSVEGTLITITPIDYDPILVGSIYIPPINNYFRNLGAALDTIFNFNSKTILVGDFNAKHTSWGCHCSDTRGNRLYNYIVNNSIDVLAPPTPTRYGINSASIIDYALIKNLNWPCNISSIPELSSDHNPIKLHFPRTSKFELPPPQLNTTWSKFTLNLAKTENLYLHTARSTSEIENEVRDLTSEILTAHGNASKPVTHWEVPFVQGELKHLFKERNRARKIWQFTRHPQDKTTLNRLQNAIKRKVNLYRQQVWEEHLTSLDTEDGSLWGTAKAFRRKAAPISALNGPTGTALSDTHKTELIAQSLESQFQLNDIQNPHKDEYITNTVDAYFTANTNNTDQIPPALPSEVIFYIKKIKVRKCPGRDGITNKMLKHLPLITIFKITNIINNMLNLRYFPSAWKTAVVVPILKPGKDPTLAESHRHISLLPILSKLAEKIISTRLNDFLEINKILIPEQHGFRPRLSTTHQLLRVVEYIKEGNSMGQCTAAVFLDIQKAFDRVWHTGLLFKLINYNIPTPLILLLNSYISNRSFTVKINRTYSQTRSISAGVAQGSILGPVLFNLYVNDILKSTKTMLCMYADDTAILSRHKNLNTLVENINEHLAHLEIWFSVWKIALNSSKTEAVFFSQRVPPPEITLQNQRIPWSHHTKYLGVYLDKTLTFRQHITQIRTKFKNVTHKYYSLICRKSNLSRRNKLLIYTLILKPLLTYAAPVWGHAARTNINLLESSQNLIIRQILDAHWYMRNVDLRRNFNIPTIRQTIRKISINFFNTVDEHDCPSIQDIPNYYSHFSVRRPRDVLVNPDFD